MNLRIGVVGAGTMGADHVRTIERSVSGAQVTTIADADGQRTRDLAEEFNSLRCLTDGFGLISSDEVEAVVIASPDETHARLVIAALEAGKPVLCEKPLAPTSLECQAVLRAERRAMGRRPGRHLVSVGFMRRFDPWYVRMREEIRSGCIGTPVLSHCISRGVRRPDGATTEKSITGSAIHELDIVPWLVGSVASEIMWCSPGGGRVSEGLADPQLMLLHTQSGLVATIEVFLGAGYGYDIRCEVVGTEGSTETKFSGKTLMSSRSRASSGYCLDWRERFAEAYRLELQAWVDAVREGREPPLASVEDALAAARVAESAIVSMRSGGHRVAVDVGSGPVPE